MDGDSEDGEGGAGGASLLGYEYQIDVSVWLALELVLVTRLTSELVLEPASQEDIEADLAEKEPSRVVSRLPMPGYKLIVQAKRRGGDAWTPTTLLSLLEHEGPKRPSAAKRLADPQARYLLVTSAGLNGAARALKVRHAGNWPKPSSLAPMLSKALPKGAGGRLAVIANEDDERLKADIDRLLSEGCRVPHAQLDACRRKLRDEARVRIAGAGGGRWTFTQLEAIIRAHGGFLASSAELEHYVHPLNWAELRTKLREHNAALILGQSGTGKTLATKMLYDELRREMSGLARVPIRVGPHELRDDTTPSPVLFDIEDPWGRFDFEPTRRPWSDQLARFFAEATPRRMIVATSRLDVALESKALDSVQPWVVRLESEHYGRTERVRLYRSRIEGLPRDLQPLAQRAESTVLDALATPLEIQKFFDALRTLDRAESKRPEGFVAEAISRSHQEAIAGVVVAQIEQRGDIRAAAVVWGLLKASDRLSRSVLRSVEDSLADRDPAMERGVSPLVDVFVAARNLRQGDGGAVTYYHPRVEAGVEQALAADRQVTRRTLRRLVDLLVSDDGPGDEWGTGAAARLLAASRERFSVSPTPASAQKIDAWLEARLAAVGSGFEDDLALAAAAGSPNSNGAEIARFLLHRPDKGFPGFMRWQAPERSEAWRTARRSDPGTRPLIEAFIRDVLPTDRVSYPEKLAQDLEEIAPGLSGAFIDAAVRIIGFGYIESDDVIAAGALQDLDASERLVDLADAVLTSTPEDIATAEANRLDIENEVYSDDYAQHLSEDDSGYTASEFIKAYVSRMRGVKGWASLVQHRHASRLRPYWLTMLSARARDGVLDPAEFKRAFQSAYGSEDEEDLWRILLLRWDASYEPALRRRVEAGDPRPATEAAALACLVEHAPAALGLIAADLSRRNAASRLAELAIGLARLRDARKREAPLAAAANAASRHLPPPFGEIVDAALATFEGGAPLLTSQAWTVLLGIENASETVRRLRVVLGRSADEVDDDVRWLLSRSGRSGPAFRAVEAAIRLGLRAEVEAALDHRFARVGAAALTAVAKTTTGTLPERLLDKASDRASPVRRALLSELQLRPDPDHLKALMTLAQDEWSSDGRFYEDDAEHPIARGAVEALAGLAQLPAPQVERLYQIAVATADRGLRQSIFSLLALTAGSELQERLFGLANQPGRASVRGPAALALLEAAEVIPPALVAQISAPLLATRIPAVAAPLTLLVAMRGETPQVRHIADALATNRKRRVLILLLIWVVTERDSAAARDMAALLPPGHAAGAWALEGRAPAPTEATLSDLGEPDICTEVLFYLSADPG